MATEVVPSPPPRGDAPVPWSLTLARGLVLTLLGIAMPGAVLFARTAGQGAPTHDPGSTSRLEWELLEAETAVSQGEPCLAASHYQAALRESWLLLGLLAVGEGDLPSARDLLTRARDGSAVDLTPSRVALAWVELHLGEVERPLRELRFTAEEDPENIDLLVDLLTALRATNQREELAAGLERLRRLAPEAAARFEAEPAADGIPLPALGSLASLDAKDREALRGRLNATVDRARHNLAVVEHDAGFRSNIDSTPTPVTPSVAAVPWGQRDLETGDSLPRPGPLGLDLVALIQTEPIELHPALALLDSGNPAAAVEDLRRRLEGPVGTEARALLGRVLVEQGDHTAGLEALKTAAEGRLGSPAAQQALARLALLSQAEAPGDRGEIPTEALYQLRRAALRVDLDRDLAWVLAEAEIDAGRTAEAERQLSSLDKRFGSVEAALHRIRLALADGREKDALGAAERARRLAPNSEEVLRLHGRLALDLEIVHTAARSIEPLVRMRPEVAEYRVLLGRAWQLRRRMGEASEALLKAVELDPSYAPAWLPLGLALAHENRFEDARTYFERVLAERPMDLEALAGLAETEERLGDPESAEARARSVLELDPGHARAHLVLGLLAMGHRDFAAARGFFEQAVTRDPALAKAHYQLSQACARLRDRDCAREHLALYKTALEGPEATYVQLERAEGSQPMTRQLEPEGVPKR